MSVVATVGSAAVDRRRDWRLVVVAGIASILISWLARWGPDWPAQEFRAFLAHTDPFALWNNDWFSGHPLAGYSVVYPLVSGVIGASLTGVITCTAGAWIAGRLLRLPRSRVGLAVEAGIVFTLAGSLLQGQLPFLMGTAFGLGALVADRAGRPLLCLALAALCSLSSPLAAAYLLIGAAAWTAVRPWRQVWPYAGVGAGFLVALLLGGASGPEPYPWTSLATVAVYTGLLLVVVRANTPLGRVLHRFAWVYLAFAAVLFPVADPIGGNVTRLGWLVALPTACAVASARAARRPALAALTVVAALAWTVAPVAVSVVHGRTDPSQQRSYFAGLLHYFHTNGTDARRVEIPMTREHWESRWVASSIPLARGWERQTDLEYDRVLYRPLTAERYRAWLDANAVGWVALPDVPIDPGGVAEAALLQHPPSWLHPVWHDAHWQVWQVEGAPPIVAPPAQLVHLDPSSLVLRFDTAGTSLLRVRGNGLWHVVTGRGCLDTTAAGWLSVTAGPGRLTLAPGLLAGKNAPPHCPS